MFEPLFIKPAPVKFVRTALGWYNVYLIDEPGVKPLNLSPERFAEAFPSVSPKARLGYHEVDRKFASNLFGLSAA